MLTLRHLHAKRVRRARRARISVRGTADRPRLSVFRSNRHLAAQLIDDVTRRTLAMASDQELTRQRRRKEPSGRRERAAWVGMTIAERARTKGISRARFDRGSYRYHGLVAALADAARRAGLAL